jgi:hypothetical protein
MGRARRKPLTCGPRDPFEFSDLIKLDSNSRIQKYKMIPSQTPKIIYNFN